MTPLQVCLICFKLCRYWTITAEYYNEQFVGAAIRESGLAREDLWITTKFMEGDVLEEVHTSLRNLGLKHLDLYLIHGPWSIKNDDVEGLWNDMTKVKQAGLAKSVGVSNFTPELLRRVVKTGKVVPAVNQIRLHPYNYASLRDTLAFCAKYGIVIEAYGSLDPITRFPGGPVDPVLAAIARRIGGTPAQVLFKWVHAKGFVVVTTTAKRARLEEYLGVVHLPDLTTEEVGAIDEAGAQGPPTPVRVLALSSRAHAAFVRVALGTLVALVTIMALCRFGWRGFPCVR